MIITAAFPPLRVRLVAGPAGSGGGRLLHVSRFRRQLPLPGRRCRPLPQPDLLHLPGLMMTHRNHAVLLVYEAWRQTITTTTYCIFKAEAVRFVLILNRCEKYVSGSFDGTNQSAKLTKCRAAGKLSNMKGQSGNLVKL